MSSVSDLQKMFGSIDIYLFDQLLKGRLEPGMRLLDAGCGTGRNLIYFMRNGYSVYGVDHSSDAVSQIRALAAHSHPNFHLIISVSSRSIVCRFQMQVLTLF